MYAHVLTGLEPRRKAHLHIIIFTIAGTLNNQKPPLSTMSACVLTGLEPQRKAYLMQNIMASRYIVAQQTRQQSGIQGISEIVGVLGGPAAQQGKPVYRSHNQPDVLGCQHYKRR